MSVNKVQEVNIEKGFPNVEAALQKLKAFLTTSKRQGVKAVIVVHGYGSTGDGGAIKTAVLKCLRDKSMCGIVRDFSCGDEWINRKKEILNLCKSLESHERKISGNVGVTAVLLK